MAKTANVIGATGLVGKQLVIQLLDHPGFDKIRIFVRRASGLRHPKIEEEIIDFNNPESWKDLVTGDILFSTMGTTIKTAKTKENQYRVDFTYQYEFAKAASGNGVSTYILVSSIGANSKSSVFYSRIKGELEDAIKRLTFKKLIFVRPSILDGDRMEKRAGEKFGLIVSRFLTRFVLKNYMPTPVDLLAKKMILWSLDQNDGFRIVEGIDIIKQ